MDKATFDKKIHRAKERMYQMNEVSRQQKENEDLKDMTYIEERLVSWALLNMSDKEFKNQIRQIADKNKTLYKS
mgnify:FL=1|jgi:hypothetical protein|tara:strand:+ start:521 stop:742 length:222 start_codon:yes stop_codon:yes gene_type:complete